jgi:2'-5' RNA ligase
MRLFIGIPIPSEAIRPYAEALERCAPNGKFTARDNHHLTIAFLGETDERKLAGLTEIIQETESAPIPLHFFRYGHFSDIWFLDPRQEKLLTTLYEDVTKRLREAGFSYDQKPFHPHLTLARKVVLSGTESLPPVSLSLTAEEITLYHSHRVDGLLRYTPLSFRRFAL